MQIRGIEFHTRPNGDIEIVKEGSAPFVLCETDRDIIIELYERIQNEYPEAFTALSKRYNRSIKNKHYFEFLLVRGFVKCNWSAYDNQHDVDREGEFVFEYFQCPMRGECADWNIICNPKRKDDISPAEFNVLKLIAQGLEAGEIAPILFLSIHTVNNHRNSILKKLKLHNIAQLVTYYHKNYKP